MKDILKILGFILLLVVLPFCSNAQIDNGLLNLSVSDREVFRLSTESILKDLGDHITIISSKDQPYEVKEKHTEETYKLFTDDGFGYYVEISLRGKKKQIPNRSYFNNLSRLPYAKVTVTFTDILYLSNFYKSGEETFTATATILQKFIGYNSEGRVVYQSEDKKNIEITLTPKNDWWGDKIWAVLLGDIAVEQTIETK